MAGRDSTPDSPMQQNQTGTQDPPPTVPTQLAELDNGLYQLLCVLTFYQQAIEDQAAKVEHDFSQKWRYGLFLMGDWIQGSGEVLLEKMQGVQTTSVKNK